MVGKNKVVGESNNYLFLNSSSLNNSSVLYTGTRDCFFSLLSFDHNPQFNLNANAKYCVSSGSGDIDSASLLKSLYSDTGMNSTNHESTFLYNSKIPISVLDFSMISPEYLFNSYDAYSGEYNFKSDLTNNFLAK